MVVGPGVADLIDLGLLGAPDRLCGRTARSFRCSIVNGDYDVAQIAAIMSRSAIVGDAVEHYATLCPGRPRTGLLRQHNALGARRSAVRRGGVARRACRRRNTKPRRAERLLPLWGRGDLDIITNCYSFTEGVEVPVLGAVLLLRPRQSVALYLQMCGRALRPAPGKERALILDHAGNVWRHRRDAPHHWRRPAEPGRPTYPRSSTPPQGGRLRRIAM